ncbi:MAG TPA: flagellar hook basal-body protein [Terriglobales bacterium]|nr:flagellar hook basal-body protein [Terriglobales bacterium]
MDSGFYSSFTGFAERLSALELVANNLANASTTGFKAQREFYRSFNALLDSQTWATPPANMTQALDQTINQFGVLGGSSTDNSQGTLQTTGNDTDVALEGSGYFAVLTANGVRYTRDGNFHLDRKRNLVTQQGDQVLSAQPNQQLRPVQVPDGKLSVSGDGSVSVDGAYVSKLRLDDFPKGTALLQEGNNYLVAPAATAPVPSAAVVRQGMLESSNSDPVRSTVALIDLQRTAQMMERALSIFNNDFNRTAAQDLPHV